MTLEVLTDSWMKWVWKIKKLLYSNRITKDGDILPIIQNNFLKTRLSDLIELNSNTTKMPLTINYSPISIGKLRLILHVEHAMRSLKQFGFTKKDVDEVKGIFSEANLYLLCGTMLIASVHVINTVHNLFHFLLLSSMAMTITWTFWFT